MKVVVTGASGHLGSYVVDELLTQGHSVIATSASGRAPAQTYAPRSSERRPAQAGQLQCGAVDVRSDAAVALLARELGQEVALVHLAAWHPPATANTTRAERAQLIETNVRGTMRAFEAATQKRAGARVVVYASSFEVYGEIEAGVLVTESTRTAPLTDYGATKLAGEDHLLAFGYEEQIRAVALRFPAIYGPGERTSRALPNFLRAVTRGEQPVISGDGADLRDQIHVRDAARAIALAVSSEAQGIFNVADGEPHSIAELAQTALSVAGSALAPIRQERVKPRRDWHMSIERARRELGFRPQVGLREGMAEQLAWLATTATNG